MYLIANRQYVSIIEDTIEMTPLRPKEIIESQIYHCLSHSLFYIVHGARLTQIIGTVQYRPVSYLYHDEIMQVPAHDRFLNEF